jgi:hypothetical protein
MRRPAVRHQARAMPYSRPSRAEPDCSPGRSFSRLSLVRRCRCARWLTGCSGGVVHRCARGPAPGHLQSALLDLLRPCWAAGGAIAQIRNPLHIVNWLTRGQNVQSSDYTTASASQVVAIRLGGFTVPAMPRTRSSKLSTSLGVATSRPDTVPGLDPVRRTPMMRGAPSGKVST